MKTLNINIWELWNDTFTNENVWAPIFFDEDSRNDILFIGLNPSFSDRGFQNFLSGTSFENNFEPRSFYNWQKAKERNPEEYIKESIEIDRIAIQKYPFFKKFWEITHYVGLPFTHIDLFFYRETSQAEFKKIIFLKDNLNDFGRKQLNISLHAVKLINPKAIIVANALATKILMGELESKLLWDDKKGFHEIVLVNRKIPIFFSSMLTDQRALDLGSLERLKWHVKQSLK